MKTYNELLKKLRIFRQERNWEKFHKPKDLAMAAAIEAAELMEEFLGKTKKRWSRKSNAIRKKSPTKSLTPSFT